MIEIRNWRTGVVLFGGKHKTLKACLLSALKSDADLRGADLRGADLRGANLRGANLYGANLYGADLRGADLRDANLYGADLRGANLRDADLRDADLYGANLRDADLRGADLYGADLPELSVSIPAGEEYWLFISPDYVVAGCQKHTAQEWREMTKEQIAKMGGAKALKYYPRLLDILDLFLGKGKRPEWLAS